MPLTIFNLKEIVSEQFIHNFSSTGCLTLPTPLNAGVQCSSMFCVANCTPNYQFPNGHTQMNIVCENGKWVIPGNNWPTMPSCERKLSYNVLYIYYLVLSVINIAC